MLRDILKGLVCLALVQGSFVYSQNWTETEFVGRSVQSTYSLDAFDFYSGTSSIIQQDFLIKTGSSSKFPLVRTMNADPGAATYENRTDTIVDTYGLGQANIELTNSMCPSNAGSNGQAASIVSRNISFKVHTGSTVTFKNRRYSQSKWKLKCTTNDSSDLFHLQSPNGWVYKYKKADSNIKGRFKKKGYPYRIEDNAGNYINLAIGTGDELKLTLTTRFNTFKLTKDSLTINTQTEPVVSFDYSYMNKRVSVDYFGGGRWEYTAISKDKRKICNAYKACVTLTYEGNQAPPYDGSTKRVVSRLFSIPLQGTYTYTYDYKKYSDSSFQVTENRGDYKIVKTFKKSYVLPSNEEAYLQYLKNPPWDEGSLLMSELLFDGHVLSRSENTFENSNEINADLFGDTQSDATANYDKILKTPVLVKTVEKKWAINSGEETPVWIGTVITEHSDFDKKLRSKKTTYSYPASAESYKSSDSSLFPSVSYTTQYDDSTSVYHLGLVKQSKLEGSSYSSDYTYYDNGLLKTSSKNGAITSYVYGNFDELATVTNPRGVETTYADYEAGIAKSVTGALGYTKTRTVENGHVKTETEWGDRTTTYQFDVFGDIEQVSSPENRSVRFSIGYPDHGGYEQAIFTIEGSTTKVFNGLGLQTKTLQNALAVGTGGAVNTKTEMGYSNHGALVFTTVPHDGLVLDLTELKHTFNSLPNGLPLSSTTVQGARTTYNYTGPFQYEISDVNGNKQTITTKPFSGFGSAKPTEILYSGPHLDSDVDILVSKDYYPEGLLKTVSTGNEVFDYIYDSFGLIESFESKAEGKIQYDHDLNGNLTYLKKATGKPVSIVYDDLDREKLRSYEDSAADVVTRYFDSQQKTKVEKNGLIWTYEYDKDKLITDATLSYDLDAIRPGAIHKFPDYRNVSGLSDTSKFFEYGRKIYPQYSSLKFSYEYSESGNLSAITFPDNERIPFMPNAFGQATQADNYVSNARYWPNGSLKALTYRNGIRSDFRQNSDHQISEIQHGSHWYQEYEIDGNNMVTAIQDRMKPTNSIRMSYDHINQLKAVTDYSDSSVIYERYDYDQQGNMTSRSGMNGNFVYNYSPQTNRLVDVNINGSTTKIIGYDDEFKISVYGSKYYGYSEDGHMVYHDDSDNVEWTYLYDGNDRKTFTFKNGHLHQITVYDHFDQLIYEEVVGDGGRTSNLIYLNDDLVARRDGEFYVTTVSCDSKVDHRAFRTYFRERNVYLYKNQRNEDYLAGKTNLADVAFMGECKITPSKEFIHYADKKWTGWNPYGEHHRKHYFRKMQYERVKVGNSYKNYYRGGFYGYYDQMDRMVSKKWGSYSNKYRKSTWWHYRDCYRDWRMVYQDYPNGHGSGSNPTAEKTWKTGKVKYKSYKWHKFSGNRNKHKCSTTYFGKGSYVPDRWVKFPAVKDLPKPNYYQNIKFENK